MQASSEMDDDPSGWQPLPLRARKLSVLLGCLLGLPVGVIAYVLATTLAPASPWWLAPSLALASAAFGAWRGHRRWRHTRWRLDASGFGLRRGHLWQTEIRVPQSRVQHLDLQRGPLQRHYHLATLVIHTAGTRNSAVSVSGLDAGDAERLRDILARQVDDDDDADA
ncbi:MAG: PH domain-containing protein [Luteimonas sp.]